MIPGNDDAIRAVRLLASKMADAVIEGRQGEQLTEAESGTEENDETDTGEEMDLIEEKSPEAEELDSNENE